MMIFIPLGSARYSILIAPTATQSWIIVRVPSILLRRNMTRSLDRARYTTTKIEDIARSCAWEMHKVLVVDENEWMPGS
jgi:hypothetical protein